MIKFLLFLLITTHIVSCTGSGGGGGSSSSENNNDSNGNNNDSQNNYSNFSSITLKLPSNSTSSYESPEFLVTGGVSGDKLKIYTDSSCDTLLTTKSISSSSDTVIVTLSGSGNYTLYYKRENSDSTLVSDCSDSTLTYSLNSSTSDANLSIELDTSLAYTSMCHKISAKVVDSSNNPTSVSYQNTITLNKSSSVAFYSDKYCQNEITSIVLPANNSSVDLYSSQTSTSGKIVFEVENQKLKLKKLDKSLSLKGTIGYFDSGYGTSGIVSYDVPDFYTSGYDVNQSIVTNSVVDTDGSIYVLGYDISTTSGQGSVTTTRTIVAKYNSQGELDSSFGTNSSGVAVNAYNQGDANAREVIELSSDKIITLGDYQGDIIVQLLNKTGFIDTSYGTNGVNKYQISSGNLPMVFSIDKASDGYVFVGSVQYPSDRRCFIGKLKNDYTLDTTFGSSNGFTVIGIYGNGSEECNYVKVLDDGKILASGGATNNQAKYDSFVVRLNSDGTIDNSFGTSGSFEFDTGDNDRGRELYEVDGNYYLISRKEGNTADITVTKFSTGGVIDTSWGTSGHISYGSKISHRSSTLIQKGKIWILAQNSSYTCSIFSVDPFNSNITEVRADFYLSNSGETTYAKKLHLLDDGRVFVVGRADPNYPSNKDLANVASGLFWP